MIRDLYWASTGKQPLDSQAAAAPAHQFFHSLKSESITTFVDDREAIAAVDSYLPYYSHSRLHSSLN
jgi:hypothetical protein